MEECGLLASSALAEDVTISGEQLLASSMLAEDVTLEGHSVAISFGLTCKHLTLQCMSIPVHL
jgi:hypothetical protein